MPLKLFTNDKFLNIEFINNADFIIIIYNININLNITYEIRFCLTGNKESNRWSCHTIIIESNTISCHRQF